MGEDILIRTIEEGLKYLKKDHAYDLERLTSSWKGKLSKEPQKFINPDLTINAESLKNFRKTRIFVCDEPSSDQNPLNPLRYISGARRGAVSLLNNSLSVLKEYGYDPLLKKYPSNNIGNPFIYDAQGYRFTHRWARHIYFLGLFRDHLMGLLPKGFTAIDIGSSYGIFSGLQKMECPDSHLALVDLPEQLILAHYYLGRCFPDSRIAGFKEVLQARTIDRSFLEKYDFILIPCHLYGKLQPNSLDLVTNFVSFAEMTRKWFDFYLKAEPFLSARYFYTVNRFQSQPTYDTDLTILDYPLYDFDKLHFRINPFLTHDCQARYMIFWKKVLYGSQLFEFIGKRK